MTPWRVIAFHTDDDIYNEMIENLRASLIEFNMPYFIKTIPHQRSWRDTHRYMHGEIRKAFDIFPDENIVYLDADAVVRQYPTLFDTIDAEVAFNYNHQKKNVRVGTLYLKNCNKVKKLIEMWELKSKAKNCFKSAGFDQALALDDYDTYILPDSYTKIFDCKTQVGPPVIEHFQASRRVRKCGRLPLS